MWICDTILFHSSRQTHTYDSKAQGPGPKWQGCKPQQRPCVSCVIQTQTATSLSNWTGALSNSDGNLNNKVRPPTTTFCLICGDDVLHCTKPTLICSLWMLWTLDAPRIEGIFTQITLEQHPACMVEALERKLHGNLWVVRNLCAVSCPWIRMVGSFGRERVLTVLRKSGQLTLELSAFIFL